MTVAIVLIAHQGIGEALRATAVQILGGKLPAPVEVIDVTADADVEQLRTSLRTSFAQRGDQDTLVITDIYGSTPANLALAMGRLPRVRVIAGLNLPMLIRALNYADLPLDQVTDRALEGGLRSIFLTTPPRDNPTA